MLDALARTFGPFLVPVTVFAIGVVGYVLLYALSRSFGDEGR